MPSVLRMPPPSELPKGPRRDFVEELFTHYREAGRPALRAIASWIDEHGDDLRGTASPETIRRVLKGTIVPRNWATVETIFLALCGIAERSPDEDRWPEDEWSNKSFAAELKERWNAAMDDYEDGVPSLPPRPAPAPVARTGSFAAEDPWAVAPGGGFGGRADDPPF